MWTENFKSVFLGAFEFERREGEKYFAWSLYQLPLRTRSIPVDFNRCSLRIPMVRSRKPFSTNRFARISENKINTTRVWGRKVRIVAQIFQFDLIYLLLSQFVSSPSMVHFQEHWRRVCWTELVWRIFADENRKMGFHPEWCSLQKIERTFRLPGKPNSGL